MLPETEVTKNCIMPALFFICNQILSLFFYQVLYISIQNLPKSHWVALATFKNLLFNHCLLLGQENLLCNCLVKYYSLCLICGKFQMVMKVKKERKTLKLVLLKFGSCGFFIMQLLHVVSFPGSALYEQYYISVLACLRCFLVKFITACKYVTSSFSSQLNSMQCPAALFFRYMACRWGTGCFSCIWR